MSKTSKKYFPEDFKKKIWDGFIKKINKINNEKELVKILARVLSPQELINIEKRLAVLYLLAQGESYREIGRIVDVRRNTISFVKKGFKRVKRIPRRYSPDIQKNIFISTDSIFPKYRYISKKENNRKKSV